MMKVFMVFCTVMLLGFSAYAAESDTVISQKYGEEGVKKFAFFQKMRNAAVKPFAAESQEYKTNIEIPYSSQDISSPLPNPLTPGCRNGDIVSTNRTVKKEYYQIPYQEKTYDIQVEKEFCSSDVVNVKQRKFHSGGDNPGETKLTVYKDGKKMIKEVGGDFEVFFSGSDMLVSVDEGCCNMGHHYEHYNWISGKTIEQNALAISFDDVPSVEMNENRLLPSGETVKEFDARLDLQKNRETR